MHERKNFPTCGVWKKSRDTQKEKKSPNIGTKKIERREEKTCCRQRTIKLIMDKESAT